MWRSMSPWWSQSSPTHPPQCNRASLLVVCRRAFKTDFSSVMNTEESCEWERVTNPNHQLNVLQSWGETKRRFFFSCFHFTRVFSVIVESKPDWKNTGSHILRKHPEPVGGNDTMSLSWILMMCSIGKTTKRNVWTRVQFTLLLEGQCSHNSRLIFEF